MPRIVGNKINATAGTVLLLNSDNIIDAMHKKPHMPISV